MAKGATLAERQKQVEADIQAELETWGELHPINTPMGPSPVTPNIIPVDEFELQVKILTLVKIFKVNMDEKEIKEFDLCYYETYLEQLQAARKFVQEQFSAALKEHLTAGVAKPQIIGIDGRPIKI